MFNSLQPHGLQHAKYLSPPLSPGVFSIQCPLNWWCYPTISSSIQFNHSELSDSLWPHELQHARVLCPPPTLRAFSNWCPSSQWHHPTISSSVIPFSFYLHSFPVSGPFPKSQFFALGAQSIGSSTSASFHPMNIQGWFSIGLTSLISFQFKGLSRVFSSTTIQRHHFFSVQPSLWSNSHIHTWLHSFGFMDFRRQSDVSAF